ncbi:MAG: tyrosine--tRNA ligase [Gemmatimonadota bacterium]|nr:tyrosine--tRNA ligase [Gemmatimonadota bacterium]MDE3214982.1 tyrosine--tRNA ligase [Gemmatimonadota bacterium]
MSSHPLLDELQWRGLLYQHTDGLAAALAGGVVSGYAGFDPTAPSLHVGNLVPVMGLLHLQRAGHRPVVLVGGGTGLIGDPSGRTSERPLASAETVAANAAAIGGQLARFVDFDGPRGALMRDNAAWLATLGAIEFMRDVGKHFTVNYMLQKESVKARLEGGISYTEFSYMLLQAYDFLELYRRDGVTLQLGGSDQWGNITAGIELIHRAAGGGAQGHALTLPLVTTASGAKFGKSEAGAVWLDPALTSPYKFYQYWINTDDRDVGRFLRFFTLRPRADVEALDREAAEHPERREAQRALAREMTRRLHGDAALAAAEEVSGFYFGGVEPSALSAAALVQLSTDAPFVEVRAADVAGEAPGQLDVFKLLTASGSAPSGSAARRLLDQGGVSVNKRKLAAADRYVAAAETLLRGEYVIVGKGRRQYALVRVRG